MDLKKINKWCWDNCLAIWKKITLNPYLKSYTQINLEKIRGQNVANETSQFLSLTVVKACIVSTNTELANIESLLLEQIQG